MLLHVLIHDIIGCKAGHTIVNHVSLYYYSSASFQVMISYNVACIKPQPIAKHCTYRYNAPFLRFIFNFAITHNPKKKFSLIIRSNHKSTLERPGDFELGMHSHQPCQHQHVSIRTEYCAHYELAHATTGISFRDAHHVVICFVVW